MSIKQKQATPLKIGYFTDGGSSSVNACCCKQAQTSTGDKLFGGINIDDL